MRLAGLSVCLPTSLAFAIASCSSNGATPPGGDDDAEDGDGGLLDDDGGFEGPLVTVCAAGSADHQSIGEAIAAAPAGAVLAVCGGTYHEQISIVDKPIAIRGVDGAAATILDAGGSGTAIDIRDTSAPGVEIEGFTIRGGENGNGSGGGVRCEYSGLRIIDSVLRENQARAGGGLYASSCALDIAGTTFADNDGVNRGGGALLIEASGDVSGSRFQDNRAVDGAGLAIVGGTVAVSGSQMRGNTAGLRGGGLFLESDATVEESLIAENTSGWTGAGVHIVKNAPLLRANIIRDNVAIDDGGGIYSHQSSATILACDIRGNRSGDDGGGIRLFESSATVTGNRITGNATADGGGGIRVSHVSSLIVDNEIRDNEATMGGGIDMDNDSSVVRGGIIADNRASWVGGGISATRWPWLGGTFEGVKITRNQAINDGGGMYIENNFFPLSLTGVEVTDNQADRGGGIFVRATDVTIRNTTIARNQAAGDGGGLYVGVAQPWPETEKCPCPPATGAVDVEFTVIHANRAGSGGALWVDTAGLSVSSSILSDNQAPAVLASGVSPAWTYNDTTPESFAGMLSPTGSSGNISANPQYLDTAFRLANGSPCIDAGDPALNDGDGSRADMGRFGGPETP